MFTKKEEKIIGNIINNSRVSRNKLSKNIQISREVIDYNIKKFEQSHLILGYQARLNIKAFSILQYKLLLKTQSSNREKDLLNFIAKQSYTHFIAKIGGNYDYIIGFSIKKIEDLQQYLLDLYEHFSDYISSHEIFTSLTEPKDDFSCMFGYNESNVSIKSINSFTLDKVDKIILQKLAKDARLSSTELGNDLHLTSAAVAYRIKQLEKKELILGYRTIIDLSKLEKQYYYVFFNIKKETKKIQQEVIKELKSNPSVMFISQLAGSHSYLIMMHAQDNKDFYKEIKGLENQFPEINGISSFFLLDFLHHNHLPQGFLDD